MNKAYVAKDPDGELRIFYDDEPIFDEELDIWSGTKEDYLYPDYMPISKDIMNLTVDDGPVQVMLVPVSKVIKDLPDDAFFQGLARKLRMLWPKGEKDDKYPWRCTQEKAVERLKWVWDVYDMTKYTEEDCLTAARKYLSRHNDNTKYMQTLKYFIIKQKSTVQADGHIHYRNESMLASLLENKDSASDEFEKLYNQTDNLI